MKEVLSAVAWIACGIGAYGLTFAYFQEEYPTLARENQRKDGSTAFLMATAGPFGLFTAFLGSEFGKHGWRLRPRKED